jgi:hypothetical protein
VNRIWAQQRETRDQIDEFPGFSCATGIFPTETGSIWTASTTTQSDANRCFPVSQE